MLRLATVVERVVAPALLRVTREAASPALTAAIVLRSWDFTVLNAAASALLRAVIELLAWA